MRVAAKIVARGALIAGLAVGGSAGAQSPGATVVWSATAPSAPQEPGSRVALTLRGDVKPGWHVYALQQRPDGPTPLKVTLDPGAAATAAGRPTGSVPVVRRDPAFGFDTQFYAEPFTIIAPVRIGPRAAPGRQAIPLNVRFQTCNGDICQPPKTVRVEAQVTIGGNG